MLTHKNIVEFVVLRRFFIFDAPDTSIVYEVCDEEGPGVKKQVFRGKRSRAEKYVSDAQELLREYLGRTLKIEALTDVDVEYPTVNEVIKKQPPKKFKIKKPPKGDVVHGKQPPLDLSHTVISNEVLDDANR